MTVHILIHTDEKETGMQMSKDICDRLNSMFPGLVKTYGNGGLIVVGSKLVYINFYYSESILTLLGTRHDYYYTDTIHGNILDILSSRSNYPRRLDSVEKIVSVARVHMLADEQIEALIKESEG